MRHLCLEKQFKEQFIRKFYFVCTMKLFQFGHTLLRNEFFLLSLC